MKLDSRRKENKRMYGLNFPVQKRNPRSKRRFFSQIPPGVVIKGLRKSFASEIIKMKIRELKWMNESRN
jgi:hypothetical protein